MGISNIGANGVANVGDTDDVCYQQWRYQQLSCGQSTLPSIVPRTMGPPMIGPRIMCIANTYVVDDGGANDRAADDARC